MFPAQVTQDQLRFLASGVMEMCKIHAIKTPRDGKVGESEGEIFLGK